MQIINFKNARKRIAALGAGKDSYTFARAWVVGKCLLHRHCDGCYVQDVNARGQAAYRWLAQDN